MRHHQIRVMIYHQLFLRSLFRGHFTGKSVLAWFSQAKPGQDSIISKLVFCYLFCLLVFEITRLRPDKEFGYYQLAKCLDRIGDKQGAKAARLKLQGIE